MCAAVLDYMAPEVSQCLVWLQMVLLGQGSSPLFLQSWSTVPCCLTLRALSGKRAMGMACAGGQWRRGDPQVVMCPEKSHPQENKEKTLLGYTQAVDAWALGVLAYELIVGHPPFERETRTDTYEQIMYRRPHYPSALSEGSRSFIAAALTKVRCIPLPRSF